MIKITEPLLNSVTDEACSLKRKRKNYNFHSDYNDPVNRLLNAFEPGTYVQPHKHENPDKIEVFIILKGKAVVVEFDDEGAITDYFILDNTLGSYGVEFPPRTWHTLISLENNTIMYEVKQGPYVQIEDKNFAPWAPPEGSIDGDKYNSNILNTLKIQI